MIFPIFLNTKLKLVEFDRQYQYTVSKHTPKHRVWCSIILLDNNFQIVQVPAWNLARRPSDLLANVKDEFLLDQIRILQ